MLVPFIEEDLPPNTADGSVASQNTTNLLAGHRKHHGNGAYHINKLILQMQSPKDLDRIYAAYDLGELGRKAKTAVPVLLANLSHQSYWVRRACAKALGKIGSREALPALNRATKDHDRYVALSAKKAIRRIK